MPFVTFQHITLQHYEYGVHDPFSMTVTINEDLGMNGLLLVQYKY